MDIEQTWIIYYDIGKKFRQFRLLTWSLLIGQFVYPVGLESVDGGDHYFRQLKVSLY